MKEIEVDIDTYLIDFLNSRDLLPFGDKKANVYFLLGTMSTGHEVESCIASAKVNYIYNTIKDIL